MLSHKIILDLYIFDFIWKCSFKYALVTENSFRLDSFRLDVIFFFCFNVILYTLHAPSKAPERREGG